MTNIRVETIWPVDTDPVADFLNNNDYRLYYDPAVDIQRIYCRQSLTDLCNWANSEISRRGVDKFLLDQQCHYDAANLVKLNMWVHDIRQQGIVKPMLLTYSGGLFNEHGGGTGESRLRVLERIPEITTSPAFVSTQAKYHSEFEHLTVVTSFNQIADLCGAEPGEMFLFDFTTNDAPWCLDWYEHASHKTTRVTPGQEQAVNMLKHYLAQNSSTVFSPDWFDNTIDWYSFDLS